MNPFSYLKRNHQLTVPTEIMTPTRQALKIQRLFALFRLLFLSVIIENRSTLAFVGIESSTGIRTTSASSLTRLRKFHHHSTENIQLRRMMSDGKQQPKHDDNSTEEPRINSITPIATTRWLALNTIEYTDQEGKDRKWDVVTRTTKKSREVTDAVCIIPILRSSSAPSSIDTLLVEQYRPPLGRKTFEFPAGLIDPNETVEDAAMRELREETGYVGAQCSIMPGASRQTCMSPGLCDETIQVVLVEVDLDQPCNMNPQQQLDSGEFCTVKRVPLKEGLKDLLDKGESMPIMGLYLFSLGLELGAKFGG